MKNTMKLTAVITIMAFLTACGHTPGQRALSGGGIGAGAGAVGAVLLNANPVTGAIIGGAAGAATGALTKKKDLNLGEIE